MNKFFQYAKAIAGLIGAVLTSVAAAIPDAPLWLVVALSVASAIAVYAVPNAITDQQAKHLDISE